MVELLLPENVLKENSCRMGGGRAVGGGGNSKCVISGQHFLACEKGNLPLKFDQLQSLHFSIQNIGGNGAGFDKTDTSELMRLQSHFLVLYQDICARRRRWNSQNCIVFI